VQKDIRRHDRLPYAGQVRISWEDVGGLPKYAFAKCLDVSSTGMRIEVPESIPTRSRISMRVDPIDFHGSAIVKHVARRGTKYIVGLELSQTVRDQLLSAIRGGQSPSKPATV
jgi:hypothetical protein